jgi:fructose-1,6-bisphosphatase/inositol monophosphatase family enzyme
MCASPFIHTIERVAPFFCVSLGLREADRVRASVVQNFEAVAVEEGDDGAREVSNGSGGAEQEQETAKQGHIFFPATGVEARQSDALSMRLSRQSIDDASLHSFCG